MIDAINVATREFRQNLDSLSRATTRLTTLEAQHGVVAETDSVYPKGVKPFRSRADDTELDEVFSLTTELS